MGEGDWRNGRGVGNTTVNSVVVVDGGGEGV